MATDTEAIEAVKRGEKDRYAELVTRYQRMVYGIAWSQLGDNDLCEEAAQETFVRSFRYLVALRHPERFGGWLARIARNVSTSILRRRARELKGRERWKLETPQQSDLQPALQDDASLNSALRDAIAELPAAHRECLVLFYLEGKDVRETSEALAISEAAVKTRLHRARLALRGRLEERLEQSLAQLAPRRDLSAIVLPLLPAMPLAAGLGASTVAAKLFAGLGQLASLGLLFVMAALQTVLAAALLGWYGKLEADNLAPIAGRQFRARMIKRGVVILACSMMGIMFLAQWASLRFGPMLVFQLLVPYCIWGLWRVMRTLRINDSRFVWGQALALFTFGAVAFFIGFLDAPFWVFFCALLPLNIVLYQTNKSKPARYDYNLFLRQATGLLAGADPAPSQAECSTPLERIAFARFLGRRFLICDVTMAHDRTLLWLPTVTPSALSYLSLTGANSVVSIDDRGACTATLGNRDLASLGKFCSVSANDRAGLECAVARVVQRAFQQFRQGDGAAAETTVGADADHTVFVAPVAGSRGYRIAGLLSIVAAFLMLALLPTLGTSFHPATPVAQPDAARHLLSWCATTPPASDFIFVMYSPTQPSPAFFGTLDATAYHSAVFDYLQSRTRDKALENFPHNSDMVSPLYHALRDNTLTSSELDTLGFTREKVLAAMTRMDKGDFAKIEKQGGMTCSGVAGTYSAPNLELMALRLACLKALGCLDQIDTRELPAQIAAHQVTPNWHIPTGYAPIDTQKAAGLFDFGWCDLRTTRAALWILQLLDKRDAIDCDACIEGLLRFHKGKGLFQTDFRTDPWIALHGQEEDKYYALECFAILDALNRIPDLEAWKFNPTGTTRESNGIKQHDVVTGQAIVSWVYQLRLEEIRGN